MYTCKLAYLILSYLSLLLQLVIERPRLSQILAMQGWSRDQLIFSREESVDFVAFRGNEEGHCRITAGACI